MKVLVGITSYGTKNDRYLSVLIEEYRSMKYEIDIVVFSNIPRTLDKKVEVIVGLPSENPWSLPFAHKRVFAERVDDYDLFIYTENDILIRESNIEAFLNVSNILPEDKIAGFMRYEKDSINQKNYVDVHGNFHWKPKSVKIIGDYTFAHFTNEHSACYLLTREQLKKSILSGGYVSQPYEGKYDLMCTAATDPYTRCGFTKLICISHFKDFELHHLSDAYVGKSGINQQELISQIQALLEVAGGVRTRTELLEHMNPIHSSKRRKWYYEPCDNAVLAVVPESVKSVLSIGCGSAETELRLVERGIECVCIPLDSVIGSISEMRCISVHYPNFDRAFSTLASKRFDSILLLNILQFVDEPSDLIKRCSSVLSSKGNLIGTIPNAECVEEYLPERYKKSMGSDRVRSYRFRDLARTGIKIISNKYIHRKSRENLITNKDLMIWHKQSGMRVNRINYVTENLSKRRRRLAVGPLKSQFADKVIFVSTKSIR